MNTAWFALGVVLLIGALYNIYPLAGVLVLSVVLALAVYGYLIRSHRRQEARRGRVRR